MTRFLTKQDQANIRDATPVMTPIAATKKNLPLLASSAHCWSTLNINGKVEALGKQRLHVDVLLFFLAELK